MDKLEEDWNGLQLCFSELVSLTVLFWFFYRLIQYLEDMFVGHEAVIFVIHE